ncbi:MAG: sensor histidine kinase [Promethearchaeota archaeon]
MKQPLLPTKFALAERLSDEEIRKQSQSVKKIDVISQFIEKIPFIFLVLNQYRQIVYLNNATLDFTGLRESGTALGKRPGELFNCIHSKEEKGGCGTSESCKYCGCINAVLASQLGEDTKEDCRLMVGSDELAYDLRVWASPLNFLGENYTTVTIQDISDEKRRLALEWIFLHDFRNTLGSLSNRFELFEKYPEKFSTNSNISRIIDLISLLVREVESQEILLAAENQNLTIEPETITIIDFLESLISTFKDQEIAKDRNILLDMTDHLLEITTDQSLLYRILENMVKNAFEAIPEGEVVTIGSKKEEERIIFWTHNPGVIPRDIELQIFQRSFSTKDPKRGLGTYSMKLLSSFLDGEVTFTTSKEKGTIFTASFPTKISPPG